MSNSVKFLKLLMSVSSFTFLSVNRNEIKSYGSLTSFNALIAPVILVEEVSLELQDVFFVF